MYRPQCNALQAIIINSMVICALYENYQRYCYHFVSIILTLCNP